MDRTPSNPKTLKRHQNQNPGEEEDPEMWANFDKNFKQVQTVLDRNRALIQQVNDNHQSKIPDNMVKNVALIQELNGNISKVVNMYSDLSSNFSSAFQNNKNGGDGKRAYGER